MAKKITPQHRHYLNVVRNFYTHFNSSKEISETFGVSRRTARRWIHEIEEGRNPLKSEYKAKTYIDRLKYAPKYFEGPGEMKLAKSPIIGEHYYIQDYKLKIGASLPKTKANDLAYGYQIIIKGRDAKGMRGVTTTIGATPEDALAVAHAQMNQYKLFRGREIFLRVFTELEDIKDIEDVGDIDDILDEFEDVSDEFEE